MPYWALEDVKPGSGVPNHLLGGVARGVVAEPELLERGGRAAREGRREGRGAREGITRHVLGGGDVAQGCATRQAKP